MTDEEIAEEYLDERYLKDMGVRNPCREAFLAGLKSQKNWHNVSEQIPTEEKDYLVKLTDGTVDVMRIALDGDLEPYLLSSKFDFYKDVEKWCEIPKE